MRAVSVMMLRFDIGGTVSVVRCLNVRRSSLPEASTNAAAHAHRERRMPRRGADQTVTGSGVALSSSPTSGAFRMREAAYAATSVSSESAASTMPGCHHA